MKNVIKVKRASFYTRPPPKKEITISNTYIRKFILGFCSSSEKEKKKNVMDERNQISLRRAPQKHLIEHDQSWQHVHEYSITTGEESLRRSRSHLLCFN